MDDATRRHLIKRIAERRALGESEESINADLIKRFPDDPDAKSMLANIPRVHGPSPGSAGAQVEAAMAGEREKDLGRELMRDVELGNLQAERTAARQRDPEAAAKTYGTPKIPGALQSYLGLGRGPGVQMSGDRPTQERLAGAGDPEATELLQERGETASVAGGQAGLLLSLGIGGLGPSALRSIAGDVAGAGAEGVVSAVGEGRPGDATSRAARNMLFSLALSTGLQGPLALARNRRSAIRSDLDIGRDYTAAMEADYRPSGLVKGSIAPAGKAPPIGQHEVPEAALELTRAKVRPELRAQDEAATLGFRGPEGEMTRALAEHAGEQVNITPYVLDMEDLAKRYEGIPGSISDQLRKELGQVAKPQPLATYISPQQLEDYIDLLQKQGGAQNVASDPVSSLRLKLARQLQEARPDWLKDIAAREQAAIADIQSKKQLLGAGGRKRVYEGDEGISEATDATLGDPDPVLDKSIQRAVMQVGSKGQEVTTEALEKLARDSGDTALVEQVKTLKGQLAAERVRRKAGGGEPLGGKSIRSGSGGGFSASVQNLVPLTDRLARLNWLWEGGKWTPLAEVGARGVGAAGAAAGPEMREQMGETAKMGASKAIELTAEEIQSLLRYVKGL